MKLQKFILLLCFSFVSFAPLLAQSVMTDEQIMAFIAKEREKGTPKSQIGIRLMERGVDVQRMRKIQSNYERQKKNTNLGGKNVSGVSENTQSRLRKNNAEKPKSSQETLSLEQEKKLDETRLTEYQKEMLKRKRQREMSKELNYFLPDSLDDEKQEERLPTEKKEPSKKVFGRDIFNNSNLTFEPEINIATPNDYRLGAGDVVYIDVWGASQKQYQGTISPEGEVYIEGFGPVLVNGLTVSQANERLRSQLGQRFNDSNIKLSVGQTKTITINVMGEVKNPGTFTLPAFATVFHALYFAGGTNDIGTMRSIKIFRNNRLVSTVDLYDYILNGNLRGNVRLASNDVIVVGPYDCLVNITGKVKRPMFYEMKPTESVETLLKYAGGFTGDAYEDNITLVRKSGGQLSVFSLNEFERNSFQLLDADSISVDSTLERYKNMVELKGAVMRPGKYQMDGNITTIRQLLEAAGGLSEDAISTRGIMHRRKTDRTLAVEDFNTAALLNREIADITLRNEDIIFIPSRKDLNEELTLTIEGEIRTPGIYKYADNTTIETLILQAGGLTDKASLAKVDVSRRIRDKKALSSGEQVAEFFSFSLKDGFIINGKPGFLLQPFDEVYVRTSPGYTEQQHVTIEGEVAFSGQYPITKKNYRLSDIVKAAGGTTREAYLKGARLERRLTDTEKLKQQDMLRIATVSDSTDVRKIQLGDEKFVGINLDQALAHPGNDRYDVILQDGDRLIIPQFNNTVSINGEVMYPNTVSYKPGEKLSYYINQCGGYSLRAKSSRAFAVQMNGTVTRIRSAKDIQPGCNIVIPARPKRTGLNTAQILSLSATLVTLSAVLVNAFK